MKRFVFRLALSISIFAASISTVFAFGGGSRGGTFGTGGFSSSTVSTQLSFEVLSELCTEINYGIVDGLYNNIPPFSTYPNVKFAATIGAYSSSESPIRYVIYVTYQSTKYYFKNNSGGLYWAYATSDDSHTGKPLFDKLEAIRSQIAIANDELTAINSKLTSLFGGFPAYVDTVTNWFSAQSTNIQNIANRLVVTRSNGTQYAVTTIVNWIYDTLFVTRSDTGRTGFTSVLNWIYNELSGTIYTKLDTIQTNTSNAAARIIYTASDGDYSLANIAYQQWKDGHIWVSTNSYAAPDSNLISSEVANHMIAYINSVCPGKYAYFWRSLNTYSSKPTIISARLSTTNKLIVVSCLNSQGNVVEYTLRSANGWNYKVDESLNPGFDTSSIVTAINRIYDWLDNADLATNTTIVNVVQQNFDSAQDGVDIASEILKLFKTVFDFDRPAPDFPSVVQYFENLGSDPS